MFDVIKYDGITSYYYNAALVVPQNIAKIQNR